MKAMTQPLLPFPRKVRIADDSGNAISEEYEIPPNAKKGVLEQLYLFEECPKLNAVRCDLHAGKKFKVADFKVVREHGMNFLVSPYYYESGGTVIDWVPASWADKQKAEPGQSQRRQLSRRVPAAAKPAARQAKE
jgi:hypothetical protein